MIIIILVVKKAMRRNRNFLIVAFVMLVLITRATLGQMVFSDQAAPEFVSSPEILDHVQQVQEEYFVDPVNGDRYRIVKIGDQVWMAENLKAVKFNDGKEIPLVSNKKEWKNLKTPAYCWYKNDPSLGKVYGALYNYYAVNTGKLCPAGWHVPTEKEYLELVSFLGGESVAGGKLKESGTEHWKSPNEGATNETGFTALPGGYRFYFDGSFWNLGTTGSWWIYKPDELMDWSANKSSTEVIRTVYTSKNQGVSVRCIKDRE